MASAMANGSLDEGSTDPKEERVEQQELVGRRQWQAIAETRLPVQGSLEHELPRSI
jgi:hypothetical protein